MTIRRSPPTAIPTTPTSQPLMTSPLPKPKLNGLPEVFLSKTEPFFNLPIYLTPTLEPFLAVGPLPTVRSSMTTPPGKVLVVDFGADSFLDSVGPCSN